LRLLSPEHPEIILEPHRDETIAPGGQLLNPAPIHTGAQAVFVK
jgi:hypothetical protein